MKKILTSLAFLVANLCAFAQQDAQFSQNMFNRLPINPGYAGSNNAICANLLGRNQWAGLLAGGGNPQTYLLSVDAPVQLLHGGAGLNVMQDKLGFEKTLIVNLNYAYRMPMGPGNLGIGLNGGMLNKAINGTWVAPDGTNGSTDIAIPNSAVTKTTFDLGFGLYYNIPNKLYFGISSTHIPASTLSTTGGTPPTNFTLNYDLARHYYIMAGYDYLLPANPMIAIKPSLFVKSDATSTQIDLNCNLMYNDMVWAGASYRVSDAIVAMAGFQHTSGVKVGVAYDITTSALKKGSYELMLGYCFKLPEKSPLQKYKNPIFL